MCECVCVCVCVRGVRYISSVIGGVWGGPGGGTAPPDQSQSILSDL